MSDMAVLELDVEELDALHNTLGISIKRVSRKYDELPAHYRNKDDVASELQALISVQQKVLTAISQTLES